MGLLCPSCLKPSLEIVLTLELLPDNDYDEVQLQILSCRFCAFRTAGAYQESRRGALDSEAVSHEGFLLDQPSLERLERLMATCPNPSDRRCRCEAHQLLQSGANTKARLENNTFTVQNTFQIMS